MFNTRINDTQAAEEQLIARAVSLARGPGQPRGDNASQVSGIVSNLTLAPPLPLTETPFLPIYPDEIGRDEDGNLWHPFALGIDTPDDQYAYVPRAYPIYDYGT